jgi:hypothetical protein
VAVDRKRTIPTEQLPLVGEVEKSDNDKPIKSFLKDKGLLPPVGLARLDS